jgi:hypothetical protein
MPVVRAPRARAREGRSSPAPRLEGGLAYCPGLDRAPAQPLGHGHSQAREGERVDPGPLGRRAERVRESLVREVRANLLAGVTPSKAAIVDAAAARGITRSSVPPQITNRSDARTEQNGHDAAVAAGINRGRALKVAYSLLTDGPGGGSQTGTGF